MASTSITKLQDRIRGLQKASQSQRARRKIEDLEDTIVGAGAAYVMGSIEKRARAAIPTVFGLDPKLTWAGVFALLSMGVNGRLGRACASTSDGLLAAYSYSSGLGKGYVIAGVEDHLL